VVRQQYDVLEDAIKKAKSSRDIINLFVRNDLDIQVVDPATEHFFWYNAGMTPDFYRVRRKLKDGRLLKMRGRRCAFTADYILLPASGMHLIRGYLRLDAEDDYESDEDSY
jgi:hypothetical protein